LNSFSENVAQLIGAIQTSVAEISRLEKELEGIKQQILNLLKNNIVGKEGSGSSSVVEAIKAVTSATASLVFSNNQEEVIQSAKKSFISIGNLLNTARTASLLSREKRVQDRVFQCAVNTAMSLTELIEVKKNTDQNNENQSQVETASAAVTYSLNELLDALKSLPDAKNLSIDQNLIELENEVESELFNCSTFIKESLFSLEQENRNKTNSVDSDLVNAIVTSTTAISNATEKLVEMAISTNKKRRDKKGPQSQIDPTIANGIIDSTKAIVSSIGDLIQSAKSSINGKIDEESIVTYSRAVASATAQLVAATRAKSDKETQDLLSKAAKAVANATSELVSALQRVTDVIEGGEEDIMNFDIGDSNTELQRQMKILKLERELERERRRMQKMGNVVSN